MEQDYLDGIAKHAEKNMRELNAACEGNWTTCPCGSCERERAGHLAFLVGND
jgi:hypothetical protein